MTLSLTFLRQTLQNSVKWPKWSFWNVNHDGELSIPVRVQLRVALTPMDKLSRSRNSFQDNQRFISWCRRCRYVNSLKLFLLFSTVLPVKYTSSAQGSLDLALWRQQKVIGEHAWGQDWDGKAFDNQSLKTFIINKYLSISSDYR